MAGATSGIWISRETGNSPSASNARPVVSAMLSWNGSASRNVDSAETRFVARIRRANRPVLRRATPRERVNLIAKVTRVAKQGVTMRLLSEIHKGGIDGRGVFRVAATLRRRNMAVAVPQQGLPFNDERSWRKCANRGECKIGRAVVTHFS